MEASGLGVVLGAVGDRHDRCVPPPERATSIASFESSRAISAASTVEGVATRRA